MARSRVSSHSGLREEVELRQMQERAERKRAEKEARLNTIYGVLDKMPTPERNRLLVEIIRKYNYGRADDAT